MYCYKCGKEIPDNSSTCKYCGEKQHNSQQESTLEANSHVKQNKLLSPIVIFGIIFFGFCFVLIIGSSVNNYKQKKNERNIITNTNYNSTTEQPTTTQPATQQPTESDPTVIISGYYKSFDENNSPILTIYYEFTNTTGKEVSFADLFADSVRQSGKMCWSTYLDEEAVSKKLSNNESIKVCFIYAVNDEYDTSPFEVKLTDLFGKKTYLSEELT